MALRSSGNLQLHAVVMTLGGGARSEKYLGIKWAGSRQGEGGRKPREGGPAITGAVPGYPHVWSQEARLSFEWVLGCLAGSLGTAVCWNLELGREEDPGLELRFAQSCPGKQDLLQSQAAGDHWCYHLGPWASPFPLRPQLPPRHWMQWWCGCDDITYLLGLEQCPPHRRAQSLLATVLRTVWDPSGFKWWLNPYEWTRWPRRESCEAEDSRDPEHVGCFLIPPLFLSH